MQVLAQRVSITINQLASLLDLLYKLSNRQRQDYYERIQSFKNRLTSLKNSLRQSNLYHSEKIYQQIYASVGMLKNQVSNKVALDCSINQKSNVRQRRASFQPNYNTNTRKPYTEETNEILKLKSHYAQLITKTQAQLSSLRIQNQLFIKDLTQAQQKIASMTYQLDRVSEQLQLSNMNNRKLSGLNQQSQLEISHLTQINRKISEQFGNLKASQKKNVQLCQEAVNQINRLNCKLNENSQIIQNLQNNINQYEIKFIKMSAKYEKDSKELTTELQMLKMKEKQLKKKIKQYQDQLQYEMIPKTEFAKVQEKNKKNFMQLSQMGNELTQLKDIIRRYESQIKQYQQQLQTTNKVSITKQYNLKATLSQKQHMLAQKQSDIQKMVNNIEKSNNILKQKNKQIEELEQKITILEQNLKNCESKLTLSLQKVHINQEKAEEMHFHVQNLQTKLRLSQQEKRNVEISVKNLESEKKNLQKNDKQRQKQIDNLKQQNSILCMKNIQLEKNIGQLIAKISIQVNNYSRLNQQLCFKDTQISELLLDNKNLRDQLDNQVQTNLNLSQQLQIIKKSFAPAVKENQSLTKKMENKKDCQVIIQEFKIKFDDQIKEKQKLRCQYLRAKIETIKDIKENIL